MLSCHEYIGNDVHWLPLRCCLYFVVNLPLLLFFLLFLFWYCICQLIVHHRPVLRILQYSLFIHTIVPVVSMVRFLQFRKSHSCVHLRGFCLLSLALLCVLHTSFMQLSVYKNKVIMNIITQISCQTQFLSSCFR